MLKNRNKIQTGLWILFHLKAEIVVVLSRGGGRRSRRLLRWSLLPRRCAVFRDVRFQCQPTMASLPHLPPLVTPRPVPAGRRTTVAMAARLPQWWRRFFHLRLSRRLARGPPCMDVCRWPPEERRRGAAVCDLQPDRPHGVSPRMPRYRRRTVRICPIFTSFA
jgi:hypothetical protein